MLIVKKPRFTLFLALALLVTACGQSEAPQPAVDAVEARLAASSPTAKAAVAMPDSESASVAEQIIRDGGNAVDAAIAAHFVLAVTEQEAGSLGGGGFMLIWMDGEATFLDYREVAPLAAHRDMYLDEDGEADSELSRFGHLSVGVPGTVAGLWAAHQAYGTLPWADLVAPAIGFARDGYTITADQASLAAMALARHEGKTNFGDYFAGMVEGAVFRQPELAEALERIAEFGPDGFYRGTTADLIVAEMERGGGLVTHADLERYEPTWRDPLVGRWRDYTVLSAPPPSSGGFAVIQLLRIKDLLAHEFEGHAWNSAQYMHLFAEIQKRVFADRAEYLGDPDYFDVPMDRLISDDYLRQRALEVDPENISPLDSVKPGLEPMNTTHFSIVDKDGNAVANTSTLNLSFGSGVVVTGAGIALNDEMDDFSAKPGALNAYGVVGNVANEIQPGKKPLSSMSPTMLVRDGEVQLLAGSPGGSTIFSSVYHAIVNILDFGMTPREAVGATRIHHQLLDPGLITFSLGDEPLPEASVSELSERGYRVEPHFFRFGDLQVIVRQGDGWAAASDPRNRGDSRVIE